MKRNFLVCDACGQFLPAIGEEATLFDTTAEFDFCGMCGNYTRTKDSITLFVMESKHAPCDCGEHIRHDNGGNYHLSEYRGVVIETSK